MKFCIIAIILLFSTICSLVFAQGRFIGDQWVSDSSLTTGNIPFNGNIGIGTSVFSARLTVQGLNDATYTSVQTKNSNGIAVFSIKTDGDIVLNKTSSTDSIIKSTCTAGALNTCSCYTSTNSNKVGAIKIQVNGVDRWIRTYDDPN